MIIIMGIVLCTVFAVYEAKKTHTIFNPMTIFCTIWAIILFFSKLSLYGMYEAKKNIYLYIIVGALFFIIGYYVYALCLRKYTIVFNGYSAYYGNTDVRYRLMYILIFLCIIYYIIYLLNVMKNIDSYSMWAVQQFLRRAKTPVISSKALRALGSFIIGPVSFAVPAITASDMWMGKKNKRLLIYTVILLVIKMLATANRTTVMLFVVFFVINGVLKIQQSRKISDEIQKSSIRKLKKKIYAVLIIGIVAFIVMSLSRNLKVIKSIYLDLAIPPRMFEIWSETVENNNIMGYGMASLNGFLFPILYFFQQIMGASSLPLGFQNIYDLIALTDSKWVYPGNGISANAYVSIYWFLYVDGRIIGIIIGMFIFGMYCSHSFNRVRKNSNTKMVCLYSMCILSVLYSICRMEFTLTNFCLAIVFIIFFAYKRSPENE